MRDKIALYCDLNMIDNPTVYQDLFDVMHNWSYTSCIAYNTVDYLVQGMWDHHAWIIDDEQFFQIGDIDNKRPIKNSRPHIDAVDKILADVQSNTIYVIDEAAKVHCLHVGKKWEDVMENIQSHWSTIYAL